MSHPAIAELIATKGDVDAVARKLGVTRAAIYKAAERGGVNIHAIRLGITPAVVACGPEPIPPETVTVAWDAYVSLVAQANSAGTVWAQAERIIATLTRELERVGHG